MTQDAIPGLELDELQELQHTVAAPSTLEAAVRRTLRALVQAGHVDERHAAVNVLAVTLARIIEGKARSGKTSTVGNDARVLKEILDGLVPEVDAGSAVDAELRKAVEDWAADDEPAAASP